MASRRIYMDSGRTLLFENLEFPIATSVFWFRIGYGKGLEFLRRDQFAVAVLLYHRLQFRPRPYWLDVSLVK